MPVYLLSPYLSATLSARNAKSSNANSNMQVSFLLLKAFPDLPGWKQSFIFYALYLALLLNVRNTTLLISSVFEDRSSHTHLQIIPYTFREVSCLPATQKSAVSTGLNLVTSLG